MPKRYKQLSFEDRDQIALLNGQGESVRSIARALHRDPGTISRELKRNAGQLYTGCYLAHRAQLRSDQRKSESHKRERLRAPRLKAYVRRQLSRGWSPERIAGRWQALGGARISHEAIYRWVYEKAPKLIACLARGHKKRFHRGQTRKRRGLRIPSRTPLDKRPSWVEQRKQAGHWEADTMIGRDHASSLQILVERKTRFVRLNKLQANGATEMRRTLNRSLSRYPRSLRRTITYDNGRENVEHLLVNKVLGTKSYFCKPMHSWEKGSVENAAGLVRRRLPKRTDFANLPAAQIKRAERWINGLPRKCLGFKTAAEVFRRSVALTS
jgi:transposase, IS30 family